MKCILSVSLHLGTNSEIYFSFCPLLPPVQRPPGSFLVPPQILRFNLFGIFIATQCCSLHIFDPVKFWSSDWCENIFLVSNYIFGKNDKLENQRPESPRKSPLWSTNEDMTLLYKLPSMWYWERKKTHERRQCNVMPRDTFLESF